ncbi:hypothetical protein Hanom_Chr10g00927661 [Helianthus anomalus]
MPFSAKAIRTLVVNMLTHHPSTTTPESSIAGIDQLWFLESRVKSLSKIFNNQIGRQKFVGHHLYLNMLEPFHYRYFKYFNIFSYQHFNHSLYDILKNIYY